jgi:TRAP-type mannitol/chloroaromatic compound transport system permease small subunit
MGNYWMLKATLIGFVVLVGLQGLAFVLRGLMVLAGHERHALNHGGHGADTTL